MICMSCTADIPPQWLHSINSNVCPGCGGDIMDADRQQILSEVRDAMNQMPNNPEGIAGWLLSHYDLKKVDENEPMPVEFHQRKLKNTETIVAIHDSEQPGPASKTALMNKFLKRAGVNSNAKDANFYKSLVKDIKSGNGQEIDMSSIDDQDQDLDIEGQYVEDSFDGPSALQKIHEKNIASRDAVRSGGGSFRRS